MTSLRGAAARFRPRWPPTRLALLGELSRYAWNTVRDLYRAGLRDRRAVPGMVVSMQTYGDQAANWQPHLHALVTTGVVDRTGAFTPLTRPPARVAEELFRRRVIRMLRERCRLEDEAAAGLLSWKHSGFSVHSASRVDPWDTKGVERLCRLPGASADCPRAAGVR